MTELILMLILNITFDAYFLSCFTNVKSLQLLNKWKMVAT